MIFILQPFENVCVACRWIQSIANYRVGDFALAYESLAVGEFGGDRYCVVRYEDREDVCLSGAQHDGVRRSDGRRRTKRTDLASCDGREQEYGRGDRSEEEVGGGEEEVPDACVLE